MYRRTANKNTSRPVLNQRPYFRDRLRAHGGYSGFLVLLFLGMAAYFVVPIIDVPFLGLSLSAPAFALIALQVLFRPPEPWMLRFQGWIALAVLIWLGVFISVVGNGLLSGGAAIDRLGWLNIIRFGYWLLLFVVTAYFSSRENLLGKTSMVLGWAVFGLGLVRLFEAVVWGRIGAGDPIFMTQNAYGFLFSLFFTFLLAPVISANGPNRVWMVLRLLLVGAAVLINGSRGSWVAVTIGILVFSVLHLFSNPRRIGWSLFVPALTVLLLLGMQFAPEPVTTAFEERFGTFDTLEQDKSYAIRELMVQKGLRLFQENPLIGIGVSRFSKETTELEIPYMLSYAEQSHFDSKSAHNSYIAILAETGLVGSLPFAALLLILGWRGLRASLDLSRQGQIWAVSIYSAFIGMSVHMWAVHSLTNSANWFMYGMVAAMIVFANQEISAVED